MSHPESNPLLAAALDYARRGWRVVPLHACGADERRTDGELGCSCGNPECKSQGKHPRSKAWPQEASTDPEQVRGWWAKWPEANVGVVLGPDSGIVSIDVDTKAGEELIRELAGGQVERTVLFKTGKGHRLLYAVPADLPAPPVTRVVKIAGTEAVRFQSTGGQCVMPPSLHPSGNFYEWVPERDPGSRDVAPMPDWLVAEMCRPNSPEWSDQGAKEAFLEGKDFNRDADWYRDVLEPAGFKPAGQANGVMRFTRPGKNSGISATVGHYRARDGSPALYVFSGSIPQLDGGRCYDKFGAYAKLHHNGDFTRASEALTQKGFGRHKRAAAAVPTATVKPAAPAEWDHFIPLDSPVDEAPPFPLHAFPAAVAEHVHAVAESVYCPLDYPALATLAAASAAIGASYVAKVKEDFYQSAGLYCALVGEPSAKKSPPIKHVIRPMQKEQSDRVEKMREDHGDEPPEMYKEGEGELFVSDVTVEKLGEMLQRQPRGLLLYKPELVGWLLAQNQYKAKGVGADRSFFLEVYDSEPITIHRKGGAAVHVSRPSLTMIGATQPDVVREFFDRRDGLAERILWAYPAALSPRGERFYEVPYTLSQQWGQVLRNLWSMSMEPAGMGKKRPRAHVLPLSDAGREAWRDYTDRLAATISDPDFPPWMRSAYGKFEGSAARLALVLQLLDLAANPESDPPACIEAQWVRAAAEMVFYFGQHARRVHRSCGTDPRLDGAKRILLWLRENRRETFKRADLWVGLRRNPLFRQPEDLSPPLTLLMTHNAIRLAPGPAERTAGRPPAPAFEVNTAVFADEGREP